MSTDSEPVIVEHLALTDIKRWCWKADAEELTEVAQELQAIAKARRRAKGEDVE